MSPALTSSIDVAQVVLYVFWIFFAGLVFWLRREDRREGYPLESDNPRRVSNVGAILLPAPKTFALPEGGTYTAPDYVRDEREVPARRTANASGAPLTPTGDPMLSNVGPSSWCERHDEVELTRRGLDQVTPLRVATDHEILAGPDPRGWQVMGADGKVAGVVKDIWVDRADLLVRYLEVGLEKGDSRLVPMTAVLVRREPKRVDVEALLVEHFANIPETKDESRVTVLEEERICAYFAGARLYAEPKRLGPVV